MPFIPGVERMENSPLPFTDEDREVRYEWHIGDPIRIVTLWKVTDTYKFPIYHKGRGQAAFFSAEHESGSLSDQARPTGAFYDALGELEKADNADDVELDVQNCAWYEIEFLRKTAEVADTVDSDQMPIELGQLVSVAAERADADDGGLDDE